MRQPKQHKDTVRLNIEDTEDEILAQKANERLDEMKPEDLISFNEAARLAE